MSLATMLSNKHEVCVLDIDESRVQAINDRKSTIRDNDIDEMLKKNDLRLTATKDKNEAYDNSDFIIVCTQQTLMNLYIFDTSIVDLVSKKQL